ncbi:MAG TPA: DEAD/DEAH box helicase [Acidimicrobiales bacterium]|nr:DEAD/DEAH box helicase [Acidimicrobiales bacterium]
MTASTSTAGRPTPVVEGFHPALRAWFLARFPLGPTDPQAAAWPLIRSGADVLVASPTGTGKTLTGFMVAIDAAYRRRLAGSLFAAAGAGTDVGPGEDESAVPAGPEVVYVSPLRALAADVHENLQLPLEGTRAAAAALGIDLPELAVAVRTGDTSAAERSRLRRKPPDLLVTTPESLYLLLTAASSRELLRGVRTVIVDEVHTLARDKRGAHLALSLERLHRLVETRGRGQRLQRIGLSATQRPLETVARLLAGAGGRPMPAIVDCGHARDLDVAVELPASELEAVASHQQFGDVLDRIAGHVRDHRTTLVFVNTRKMAERVAHQLAERLCDDGPGRTGADGDGLAVAAHHGSLSAARRRLVEARLRAGELRALVATASLELGIDVGPVELVCQIGSPRAIGTFLQRVGRANHHVKGTPAGRLYPLTRDELVECTALLAAVRAGRLDALVPPVAPLDVLAQQLVAEVAAAGECGTEELFELTRSAAPYAGLDRATFDRVVELVCWGIVTGRGRRGAYLHHDAVHGRLRPRRAARITALTAGGAIPETGDYRVVLDPDGVTVGSVHEDFAVEANIGDVFLLGTHSWRVRQVEVGTVRVADAGDAAPTVPFWLGEAPARTAELSEEVGRLRASLDDVLATGDGAAARRAVVVAAAVTDEVADQVVHYLEVGRAALGVLPTHRRLVVERFFDDAEGMQLVVHSSFGGRVNRAFGLALRKRFCVTFDFELQAAADDDTVVISLGPQHSFPLSDVPSMVSSRTAEAVLVQAVLLHPMLQARWRWNLNRALVVPRARGGQRRPIHLQRMEADDLLAAAWPALAACQENTAPGPITVPDHVLVRQTVADCLSEPLDAEGLVSLLRAVESGEVEVRFVESAEPSVLAHGILTGRPYTFLDGAPLEERRTRAVPLRRGLGAGTGPVPVPAGELAPFHPDAVAVVLDQVRPRPRDADELHDLLLSLVRCRPVEEWREWYEALEAAGRASVVDGDWAATERRAAALAVADDDEAAAECARGHLDLAGPVTVAELVLPGPLPSGAPRGAPLGEARARTALARLEASGAALQLPDGRWCARHLLVRLYQASRGQRRRAVEAASIGDFLRALTRWQHAAPGTRLEGRAGLLAALEQLQGIEAPAGDWESEILPARVTGYDPRWLDELCLAGEVAWGRLTPRAEAAPPASVGSPGSAGPAPPAPTLAVPAPSLPPAPLGSLGPRDGAGGPAAPGAAGRRGSAVPSPATPLGIVLREDLGWQLAAVRNGDGPVEPTGGPAADLLAALRRSGACFRSELGSASRRLPVEVDEGLWDLVARGLVTADAFSAVRALLSARQRWRARQRSRPAGRLGLARRRAPVGSGIGEGRWSLLPEEAGAPGATQDGARSDVLEGEELAEAVAGQLLLRWGVVAWELWARESYRVPWRDVVRALRRLEARGLCLGGRFVAGLSGEQYALEEAAGLLSELRGRHDDAAFSLAASDPLNLTGTVVPGPRVPATRRRHLQYRDGTLAEERPAG